MVAAPGKSARAYSISSRSHDEGRFEITLRATDGPPEDQYFRLELGGHCQRLGHDRRYSVDIDKVTALGWAKQRTLDEAAEVARSRGLLEDEGLLERFGEAQGAVDAARLLTYKVIDEREKQAPPSASTNLARVAGTWAVRLVSEFAFEVFGFEGLEYGSFADSFYRLGLYAGTASGTTEVQLNLLASRHLGLPRE